jgi:hypothetical protein
MPGKMGLTKFLGHVAEIIPNAFPFDEDFGGLSSRDAH